MNGKDVMKELICDGLERAVRRGESLDTAKYVALVEIVEDLICVVYGYSDVIRDDSVFHDTVCSIVEEILRGFNEEE